MKTILLCAAAISTVVCAKNAARPSKPNPTQTSRAKTEQAIRAYQRWTKVNPTPQFMEPVAVAACAAPSFGNSSRVSSRENPHLNKWITVWVNAIGKRAMMTQQTPKFPVGSIIVKEKLASPQSRVSELLTVMEKKPRGYNTRNGDWQYSVWDGAGTKIKSIGKLSACQPCHASEKSSDYIFRSYLPYETTAKLR